MSKFNQVANISFSIITEKEGEATEQELMYAVLRRLVMLKKDEIAEAVEFSGALDSDDRDQHFHRKLLSDVNNDRQELGEQVLEQLKSDVEAGDYTVLFSLLEFLPSKVLEDALPE